jgi:hypothetical protein
MKLERYLILNRYFLSLFGFNKFSELRDKLAGTKEGFDSDGRSALISVLRGLEDLKIDSGELLRYDEVIKEYSERLSQNRRENITLKYFQYLAVLFSEIFLDRYFNRKLELLSELNLFLEEYYQAEKISIPPFTESELKKLAYWMATGSGKTLIMHINYWQFLKYNQEPLDNIILVTPNEGLSKQHFNETQKSGIPCRLYTENPNNLALDRNEVLIIDIHKLTEEKKGAGVTVEPSYFEGRNLVFIDEGHKGQATEEQRWKKLREELGKDGFIFEYSATFGQVIGERNKDLLEEYAKAIIFDYSYKYFYDDGYGKDFYVYNLREDSFTQSYEELILTANFLSFYEQSLLYENYREELKEHLIEKPLWAFVGSKVSGAGLNSDVLKVVQFLKKVTENRKLLQGNIARVLGGKSSLLDLEGNDIFKDRFHYIRGNGYNLDEMYQKLFNSNSGALYLYELKSAEGEIGLKLGEGEYFGVINIGDVASFKKLLGQVGFEVRIDNFTPSLFEKINQGNSKVNILLGAKKFIEGWDSWRVCSMGLINMGKGEGPQIVQLFGRGVRLKGRDLSLKRSAENKYHVKSLETLNIFGLNADYINTFLEAITREEVKYEEIRLPIRRLSKEKWSDLYVLKPRGNFDFSNHFTQLELDDNVLRRVTIDIRPKIKLAHGLATSVGGVEEESVDIVDYISLLDWEEMYLELLNYKTTKGYFNLRIPKELLAQTIRAGGYNFYALPYQVELRTFADLSKLQEITLLILQSYVDKFYNSRYRRMEAKNSQLSFLVKEDENLIDYYTLKITEDKKKEIKEIQKLMQQVEQLYQKDSEEIPTIHFDKHLYTPLVAYRKDKDFIKTEPPKLNEGETEFVSRLRDYVRNNKDEFQNKDVFLLRNLVRRGMGFFRTGGFYPDFVMWVKDGDKQTISFMDPHGIRNDGNFNDDKIQLHKDIKEIEQEVKKKYPGVKLESSILSVSKYKDIKDTFEDGKRAKEDFEKRHVFFMEDKHMMDKVFKILC